MSLGGALWWGSGLYWACVLDGGGGGHGDHAAQAAATTEPLLAGGPSGGHTCSDACEGEGQREQGQDGANVGHAGSPRVGSG